MSQSLQQRHSSPDLSGALNRLLDAERWGGGVVSLYANLDPRDFATAAARASEFTSLLDEAMREAPSTDWEPALEKLRGLLDPDSSFRAARGLAVFCTREGDVLDVVATPRAVPRQVSFGERPMLRNLLDAFPDHSWCVLLVNRRAARILIGSRQRMIEIAQVVDEIPRRHDQGGWSQSHLQRWVDTEAHRHLQRAAEELRQLHDIHGFRHLLLASPKELHGEVRSTLHTDVASLIEGWVEVDIEHASVDEVRRAAAPVIEEWEANRQRELLERVRAGLAGGAQHAAGGLAGVLGSLTEQRVATLLVAEGYSAGGVRCRQCGWLGGAVEAGGVCPADGGELEELEDVVEAAVEAALRQSAEVVTVGRVHAGPGGPERELGSRQGNGVPTAGDPNLARAVTGGVGGGKGQTNVNGSANGGRNAGAGGNAGSPAVEQDRHEYLELLAFGSIAALLRY